MATLPPVNLGVILFLSFMAVLALRKVLENRFVLSTATTSQPERQFLMDLSLALRKPFAGEVRNLPMRIKSKAPMAAFRELYMESFLRIYPGFCNMAANYLKVTPEGDVYPCCRAPAILKMGIEI